MNWIDYSIVAVYIAFFLGMGYFFKDNKDSKDYFLGGRSMGWFPLSLSTMATQLSAISFVSAPAFVGLKLGGGMKWLTFEFAVPLAMIAIMLLVIPPLFRSGVVSIYAYVEERFSASTRLVLSVVFQISRALGTGVMVYTIAIILQAVLDARLNGQVNTKVDEVQFARRHLKKLSIGGNPLRSDGNPAGKKAQSGKLP